MTHVLISCSLGLSAPLLVGAPEMPDVPPAKASEAKVPDGYHATIAVRDLTFPTSVAFGPDGAMYVAEAGYSYGKETAEPRILRIAGEDDAKVIASSGLEGPINDLLWHDDHLFVSHRGKISVVDLDGEVTDLVTDLPSHGDHHNNQLTAGPDGKIYFGQGTLTNSGVVGPDNAHMGWLSKHPEAHDVPAKNIELNDKVFESKNPRKEGGDQTARTRAFHAFGEGTDDLIVKGATKAGGTILKMNPDGSDLEVHAWGLRNPYGVLWLPDGRLMVSENGMDVRGSRPVANDKEDLYQIKEGAWYGWPDYASGKPVTDPEFAPEDGPAPEFLMKNHPEVENPLMTFPEHSSAAKMAWSADAKFGRPDRLFVAFFGHMSPMTGKTQQHGGHRVVAINLKSKEAETFFSKASHGGKEGESGHHGGESGGGHSDGSAGASKGGETVSAGPRRLIDVEFGPDGALYIVDFGTLVIKEGEAVPVKKTGLVWKVAHRESSNATD